MIKFIIPLLLLVPICVFAQTGHIAPDNMVILESDYPHKSTWSPTEEQAQEALLKIYEFINNPSNLSDWQKREIEGIKKNLSSYKVQFIGIEIEGEKRIWCNFFTGDSFDYWEDNVVMVHDGGFWFWQIQYVLETGECINFISNGYA
jgi:hypothetical protein